MPNPLSDPVNRYLPRLSFVQVLGILLPHWPEKAQEEGTGPKTITGPWLYMIFKMMLEILMVRGRDRERKREKEGGRMNEERREATVYS